MPFKQRFDKFKLDIKIWWCQHLINIGATILKKGCMLEVGQRITLPAGPGPSLTGKGTVTRTSAQTVWIENMFYNFKQNKVTYSWSDKPPRKTSVVKIESKS